jgi:hypothetical protein
VGSGASASGPRKPGLDEQALASFPIAFQHGMACLVSVLWIFLRIYRDQHFDKDSRAIRGLLKRVGKYPIAVDLSPTSSCRTSTRPTDLALV